jgi:hypothetical protein
MRDKYFPLFANRVPVFLVSSYRRIEYVFCGFAVLHLNSVVDPGPELFGLVGSG